VAVSSKPATAYKPKEIKTKLKNKKKHTPASNPSGAEPTERRLVQPKDTKGIALIQEWLFHLN
jgi:hypothetical protein